MRSMTGFGFSDFQDERLHASLGLKSYNSRYLEVYVTLPPYLDPLEPRVREFLTRRLNRGRVEVTLRIQEYQEDLTVRLDRGSVRAYTEALRELIRTAGLDDRLGLAHLLSVEGLLKSEQNRDLEGYWKVVEPLLEKAFGDYEATLRREGETTREDIARQLDLVEREMLTVDRYAPELERRIVADLRERFTELLGDGVDESRVYAEAAVVLMKANINEEISRLRAHLAGFRSILEEPGAVGKKLDFICQELNREINTIGSKSLLMEVNAAVIQVKDAIEKIREQLRNVE